MSEKNKNGLTEIQQRRAGVLATSMDFDGVESPKPKAESRVRGGTRRLRRQGAAVIAAVGLAGGAGAAIDAMPKEPVPVTSQTPDRGNGFDSYTMREDDENPDTAEISTVWGAADAQLRDAGYENPSATQVSTVVDSTIRHMQTLDPSFTGEVQPKQTIQVPEILQPNGS